MSGNSKPHARGNYRGWSFSRPRGKDESYATYRKSLKIQGFTLHNIDLKPRLLWNSTENGTYRRAEHEPLIRRKEQK